MPLIRAFLSQRAGSGAQPIVLANPGTFVTLNMSAATGAQTVHLPVANSQRADLCAVRVVGGVPVHTVAVQSPPGTTIDTFLPSTNGTRSYIFDGSVYRPFGASVG